MKQSIAAVTAALVLVQPIAAAGAVEAERRAERVQLAKGATSTVIRGQVKGRQFVDYRLRAGAGQTLAVTLKPTNPSNYFNINPPGSEVSMFIGSTSGAEFKGMLPTDGDYTVRVYLMRAAARRNEAGGYTLTIGLTGKPLAALPAAVDALIPGTPYHASATIPCGDSMDPKVRECKAFVTRRGRDGTATVEVRWPNSTRRRVLFVQGKPVASDWPEPLSVSRKGDNSVVGTASGERLEIPDVLVTGG